MNNAFLIVVLTTLNNTINYVSKSQRGANVIHMLFKALEFIREDFLKADTLQCPEIEQFNKILAEFQVKENSLNRLKDESKFNYVDDSNISEFEEFKKYCLTPFTEYNDYLRKEVLPKYPVVSYTLDGDSFMEYISEMGAVRLNAILQGRTQGLENNIKILKSLTKTTTNEEMISKINHFLDNATKAKSSLVI